MNLVNLECYDSVSMRVCESHDSASLWVCESCESCECSVSVSLVSLCILNRSYGSVGL